MKRPSFQFYPADWRNDAALRMCPLAARGLWWEMICVMHTCEPYGHLIAAGKAIEPEELARIVGESAKDVRRWLAELERHQIFSRTEAGIIYCRRMVKDENERDGWRDRQGKSRAKHLSAVTNVTAPVTQTVTGDVTPMSPRSSSSPSSSSSEEGSVPKGTALDATKLLQETPQPPKPPSADDRAWVFNDGLRWLALVTHRGEDKLRPLVGRWLKVVRDDASQLRLAIEEAMRQDRLAEVIPWLQKAVEARAKPLSANGANGHGNGRREPVPMYEALNAQWEQSVKYFHDHGKWIENGPNPREFGCRAPVEILARYGFKPVARKLDA